MEDDSKKANIGAEHAVVSHEQWVEARKALLEKEKELSKQIAAVAAARQALPWERVEKDYRFYTCPEGEVKSLGDLFVRGANLVVQHVMFEDHNERPCCMCSHWTDQFNHMDPYLRQHCSFALVMAASVDKIAPLVAKKQWTLPVFSVGAGSEFGRDFGVSFTAEEIASGAKVYNYGKSAAFMGEMHGFSVFRKDAEGRVYHTYSTYSAGLSELSAALKLFDLLPDGRNEKRNLDWIKHREDY